MNRDTDDGSDDQGSSSSRNKYVLELQIWGISFVGGMLALTLATAAFFLYFLLIALAGSVQIGDSIALGVAILATVIISKVVIDRLWRYAKISFIGISSYLSTFLPAFSEIGPEHATERCHDTSIGEVFVFGILATILTGFFLDVRWTCETANPSGGMIHAVCDWFPRTQFLELQLYVVRILYGAIGVGGVFFSILTLISLVQAYRDSILAQWVQRIYDNFWVNPRYSFHESHSNNDE